MQGFIYSLSRWTSVLLLLLLAGHYGTAQQVDGKQFRKKADAYMEASVRHDYFSGSVLIAKNGQPVFSKGYGMANYELNVPNTTNTVFRIASLTKQFTAVAIMQLQERGKLKVSDSICKYLDQCPEAWNPITIRHLLTHTSGIPNVSSLPDWDEKHSIQPYSISELVNLFRGLPLQFAPGEKYKYSNSGYNLLGLIIEKVSGMSYYDFLQNNLFKPLGMNHTGFCNPRTITPNRASGYYCVLHRFVNAPYLNMALTYSAGSLESTLGDLLLWDQALYTNRLLSPESLREMFTPFKNNYGYGAIIGNKFDQSTISHAGSLNGFSTYLFRFPTEQLTIIVLANSDKASATKVAHELAAIVFNKPYKVPQAQLFEILSKTFEQQGLEATINQYRTLKASQANRYKFGEELLNDLGYDLLELKKIKAAIAIFTLNTTEYPRSSYAYDLLGEAYFQDKDNERAMASYKKALELNPSNEYALKGIQKIQALANR